MCVGDRTLIELQRVHISQMYRSIHLKTLSAHRRTSHHPQASECEE